MAVMSVLARFAVSLVLACFVPTGVSEEVVGKQKATGAAYVEDFEPAGQQDPVVSPAEESSGAQDTPDFPAAAEKPGFLARNTSIVSRGVSAEMVGASGSSKFADDCNSWCSDQARSKGTVLGTEVPLCHHTCEANCRGRHCKILVNICLYGNTICCCD